MIATLRLLEEGLSWDGLVGRQASIDNWRGTCSLDPWGDGTPFGVTLKTAGTQSLTATDTATPVLTSSLAAIPVNPAAASALALAGFPASVTAGTAGRVTVTLLDAYGNLASGYRGTVHLSSTDPQAQLPADYTFTAADAGAHAFSITLRTAGSQSLMVTDTASGNLTGTPASITVSPAAPATLALSGFPPSVMAGVTGHVMLTLRDAFGKIITGYRGTVHFTSSDPQAALPADYTFTSADAGARAFPVAFKTAGPAVTRGGTPLQ
jgi:hypothetical protein